jgi:hypothetical protein
MGTRWKRNDRMPFARSTLVAMCILAFSFASAGSMSSGDGSAHGHSFVESPRAISTMLATAREPAMTTLATVQSPEIAATSESLSERRIPDPTSDSSDSPDSGRQLSNFVAAQDWLGPISAVALSPFFGLACLSGIATYGPTALREHSSLLGVTGPMNNPVLFWSMAFLTLVTSLPRWTKFSKPIALAIDKVEAYSAIIILVIMRFTGDFVGADPGLAAISLVPHDTPMLQAGVLSLPMDALLAIAMAVNMIVVHTIKLLVDVLVWLVPFPSVDAMLEMGNKTLCAGLMSVYAVSPLLALCLNLGLFIVCAMLFFKARRRLKYFHEMIVMPIWTKVLGTPSSPAPTQRVFLSKAWKGFPALSCGELVVDTGGVATQLKLQGWIAGAEANGTLRDSIASGILSDTIEFETDNEAIALLVRKGFSMSCTPIPVPSKVIPT